MDSQAIDWAGIRAQAVLVGVRESARRAAAHLPPEEQNRFVNRALQRSAREGWIVQKHAVQSAQVVQQQAKPMSSNVITGADAAALALTNDSIATRLGFSKAARKVAQHAGELEPADLMDKDTSQAAKHWHGVAAGVHGWEQKQDQTAVMVNVALLMG